jgi:hypothetical protein
LCVSGWLALGLDTAEHFQSKAETGQDLGKGRHKML